MSLYYVQVEIVTTYVYHANTIKYVNNNYIITNNQLCIQNFIILKISTIRFPYRFDTMDVSLLFLSDLRSLYLNLVFFSDIKTQQAIFQTDDLHLPPDRRSGLRYRYINNWLSLVPFFKSVWGRCIQVYYYGYVCN